jgi:polyisoprenoid-binding protein YceI
MSATPQKFNTRAWILALMIIFTALASQGQVIYKQSGVSKITIAGTSTMHDWTMGSSEATYNAVFEANAQGNPVKLASLVFSIPAESLKSGKGAMDKNAYSALKTDKNKQITYQLVSSKMEGKSIICTGKLTIAGTTKQVEVEATWAIGENNSLQCKGSKKIAMSDFNVEPPSFMFGSVKTGNEITISFDVTLAPKKLQPITAN